MERSKFSLMTNTRIGVRVAMSLLLPIIGLLLFSAHIVVESGQTVNEMKRLGTLANLGPMVGSFVHELQKERGTFAVYIGSGGKKLSGQLLVQKKDTDVKYSALTAAWESYSQDSMSLGLEQKVGAARDSLAGMAAVRDKALSLELTVFQMAEYYTSVIARLLGIIEELAVLSSDAEISNAITAYTSFLQGKERAGQERAMAGAGFGAGKFSPAIYKRFIELIAQQETFFGLFEIYGSVGQKEFFRSSLVGPEVDEVERMRKVVIDSIETKDTQGIEGPYWFSTITMKIDLMKNIENKLAFDLEELTSDVQLEAQNVFYLYASATFAILLLTSVLVLFVIRGITRPIAEMTNAMTELAGGNKSTQISGIERGDEIGSMAVALQVFKQSMIDLAEAEERFRSISNSSSIAMIVATDHKGNIVSWNPAAEKIFGYSVEDITGRSITEIMPERYREAHTLGFERAVSNPEHEVSGKTVELYGLKKNGEEFPLELSLGSWRQGDKKYFSAIIHDITERNRTEEALRRSQKMEAIGELTGGLAHDFNNLLGIIIGNHDLINRKLEDGSKLQKQLEKAQNAALRGVELTRRLLNFSRQSVEASSPMNVNSVIGSLEELVGKSLTSKVTIEVDLADDLWMAELNPGDLEDSIINLSLNARDAMENGGRLIIETRNAVLDNTMTQFKKGLEPGEYVEISVSDTGVGMSRDLTEKIFDPFFTTKGKNKGTGLGLAMVYSFVQRSKGYVSVYSEEGIGTTFLIHLPRSQSMAERTQRPDKIDELLPTGSETVLVVDDEKDLAAIAEGVLEELGYTVFCVNNGDEALQILNDNDAIDLLFSDIVMPGSLDGFDLAETATKKRPDLKVLLTSGFTGKMNLSETAQKWEKALIRKPYRNADLAKRVRETLDEA